MDLLTVIRRRAVSKTLGSLAELFRKDFHLRMAGGHESEQERAETEMLAVQQLTDRAIRVHGSFDP